MPLFIFFVVVAEDELNPRWAKIWPTLARSPRTAPDVVALGEGHSRVAECTRLTPEGGYPGRCKLFFRSTHGARTQEHSRI